MKVLFVASYNKGRFAAFIVEQADALRKIGVEVELFGIVGKGIKGYLNCLPQLRMRIKKFNPDVIHAHFGLSGLFANLQRRVPVVTTYHGSDINVPSILKLSKMCMLLSKHNIFVSQINIQIANAKKNYTLLPCGVDLETIAVIDKTSAREQLGWSLEDKKIIFAGAFDNEVKNPQLALKTMQDERLTQVELIELKGYSRTEICLLFSAADAFLMTSHTEGSPQVVKEAMACGCPIVSVDVGDVQERIEYVSNSYISPANPSDLAARLSQILNNPERTNGREKLIDFGLDNQTIAQKLLTIYNKVLARR